MTKKIIFSANSLWFIYNFYEGLIREFQNKNYEIFVTGKSDHTVELLKEMGVYVIEIPFASKSSNPIKDLGILFNYLKIYKKIKPDCVLNFTIKANIYGAVAAKYFSIPCINTQPGLGTVFMYNNLKSLIAKILFKITQNYPLKIFVLNKNDYNTLLVNKLVPKKKLTIIPGSGIDIDKFSPLV